MTFQSLRHQLTDMSDRWESGVEELSEPAVLAQRECAAELREVLESWDSDVTNNLVRRCARAAQSRNERRTPDMIWDESRLEIFFHFRQDDVYWVVGAYIDGKLRSEGDTLNEALEAWLSDWA